MRTRLTGPIALLGLQLLTVAPAPAARPAALVAPVTVAARAVASALGTSLHAYDAALGQTDAPVLRSQAAFDGPSAQSDAWDAGFADEGTIHLP